MISPHWEPAECQCVYLDSLIPGAVLMWTREQLNILVSNDTFVFCVSNAVGSIGKAWNLLETGKCVFCSRFEDVYYFCQRKISLYTYLVVTVVCMTTRSGVTLLRQSFSPSVFRLVMVIITLITKTKIVVKVVIKIFGAELVMSLFTAEKGGVHYD